MFHLNRLATDMRTTLVDWNWAVEFRKLRSVPVFQKHQQKSRSTDFGFDSNPDFLKRVRSTERWILQEPLCNSLPRLNKQLPTFWCLNFEIVLKILVRSLKNLVKIHVCEQSNVQRNDLLRVIYIVMIWMLATKWCVWNWRRASLVHGTLDQMYTQIADSLSSVQYFVCRCYDDNSDRLETAYPYVSVTHT